MNIQNIINKITSRKSLHYDELLFLLNLDENSIEVQQIRDLANKVSRLRFSNKAFVMAQIGIENRPCPADCKFCSFAKYVNKEYEVLSIEEILKRAYIFLTEKHLKFLFLMAMHDFDKEYFSNVVYEVAKIKPDNVELIVNIGDSPKDYLAQLKKLGITGAYHVCRLREGTDTALSKDSRLNSIQTLKDLSLKWFNCCEPIAPEHSNEEILDQILQGNTYKCFQHAAMARVNFEGGSLNNIAELSKNRISQIVAVITLASIENDELTSIAVHEPDELSLLSGANALYAEAGKNPRDLSCETSLGRGLNVNQVLDMLNNAKFKLL